jgi:hypothetical protein
VGVEAPAGNTFYQVFVGKGTAFEGRKGVRLPHDMLDRVPAMVLVAEAGESVPWTKPQDLRYDPGKPLPPLGDQFPNARGFFVALADGDVRFVGPEVSEQTLRNAITRNDGRPPGPDW